MRLTRRHLAVGVALTTALAPLGWPPMRESIEWHAYDFVCRQVSSGDLTILKLMALLGFDLSKQRSGCDGGPLHAAISSRSLESVAWILAHGANPNIDDNKWGTTALGVAAYDGEPEIVELLLDAGADVTITGEFGTPIEAAATQCHRDVVRVLAMHGAHLPDGFAANPECL